jgi:2-methylfumaryl-CoA hydratase
VARRIHRRTGNFLEDFYPGQVFRHKGGKTVTEGLFSTFTEFAMTSHPCAKNARYARAYGFSGLVCPPGLVMLVGFSQTVEDVSENARTNLEYIDMRFGAPVYVGDTIEATTKVLSVRASKSRPDLGIVHVQSTARKACGTPDESVVCTWQRKVQVFKRDPEAKLHEGDAEPDSIECPLVLPAYDPSVDYAALAHLSSPDTYFEDFEPGTVLVHSRGRTMTSEHIHLTAILDNTSQVHCNQLMIDRDPERYAGGKLIIFGGIPFTLCLGLSSPDVGDNALGDVIYTTGRHTAPLFEGDTVFAETEILAARDFASRPDLGLLETRLRGYKFEAAPGEPGDAEQDVPAGFRKVQIFELDRQLAMKRRSHYAA